MGNTYANNVIRVDTSAAFTGIRKITAIKYIGASTGTAVITTDAASGTNKVWEEAGTTNTFNTDLNIHCGTGVYVTVTNSAVVYLYT
jgi:hypothetical protein